MQALSQKDNEVGILSPPKKQNGTVETPAFGKMKDRGFFKEFDYVT